MKIERDFHMIKGDGETSYAKNSRMQRRAIRLTGPMVVKAIKELMLDSHPQSMVIADLGCSSGENTLLFVSTAISGICENTTNAVKECPMEVQFFLNDLPGSDFNQIFQSLEQFEQSIVQNCGRKGLQRPAHYIAGVPGSFYNRLFPCNSVHLFHSSLSLMWLSQVPEHLDGNMNEGNIHIGETTPLSVVKLYQDQFEKDFSRFIQMRCRELVPGGRMVLTVLGRKGNSMFHAGAMTTALELLANALHTLVAEGHIEKKKLDSFNVPMYLPSVDELKQLVLKSELLDISDIHLVSRSWKPPMDDNSELAAEGTTAPVVDGAGAAQATGKSISTSLRAVMESLIVSHFGESIVDGLFEVLAHNITSHAESDVEKSSLTVIALSLARR